jgi:predicted small secreted protein
MKQMAIWVVLGLSMLLLTACAATTGGKGKEVACPSCGYEFDVERYGS